MILRSSTFPLLACNEWETSQATPTNRNNILSISQEIHQGHPGALNGLQCISTKKGYLFESLVQSRDIYRSVTVLHRGQAATCKNTAASFHTRAKLRSGTCKYACYHYIALPATTRWRIQHSEWHSRIASKCGFIRSKPAVKKDETCQWSEGEKWELRTRTDSGSDIPSPKNLIRCYITPAVDTVLIE
jgi:hypothetical protein